MTYVRTVRTHKRTAPKVAALRKALSEVSGEIYGRFPVAHATNRIIVQVNNLLSKLVCSLDDDLYDLLTHEETKTELGRMYSLGVAPPNPADAPDGASSIDDEDEVSSGDDEVPSRPPLLIRS